LFSKPNSVASATTAHVTPGLIESLEEHDEYYDSEDWNDDEILAALCD